MVAKLVIEVAKEIPVIIPPYTIVVVPLNGKIIFYGDKFQEII
ncbi:hypothetical protein ACWOAH_11685 [Vagococcus vulneris]|nr:hypothetical protein [Vagococcus vulneris]